MGWRGWIVFYRKITTQSKQVLKAGGYLAFEIGHDQRKKISNILKNEGFVNVYSLKDLGGNDRVVIGSLKDSKI
jgi:release factor glutamine methyltransferase